MNNKYFNLFSDCKITKGAVRATIADLSRSKIYIISNDLADILNDIGEVKYKEYLNTVEKEKRLDFEQVIEFLLIEEIGFFTETPELFPKLSEEFNYPAIISNCIIDFGEKNHDMKTVLEHMQSVGCYDLQLRFFNNEQTSTITRIIEVIDKSTIKSIELFVKWNSAFTKKMLKDLTEKYFKIKSIYLHSAPSDEAYIVYPEKYRNNMGNIIFIEQSITDSSHCGYISPQYFTYDNSLFFNESKKANNCLSKKMGIDVDGNIKNCPAFEKNFGNIYKNSVKQIVSLESFQSKWKITKDQIDVCKDCEFRYVCTDCRAFTEEGNQYGKPIKCGYDPYTTRWKSEKLKSMLIKKV